MVREKLLRRAALVAFTLIVASAAACRPSTPLKVATIQTGRSLNSDNSVGNHTTRFRPQDTMFVAILTDGAGSGTFVARWTYAGRQVSEDVKKVSYGDGAATEFHIKNSSGFPPGEYAVEILLDGKSIGSRTLRVEK
ncbi:MAG TPA: hypothetical protein VI485_17955 [Vicinamibacterales bacterium]|nr:hypothetical protein [Vicinamibacterales bacterium]